MSSYWVDKRIAKSAQGSPVCGVCSKHFTKRQEIILVHFHNTYRKWLHLRCAETLVSEITALLIWETPK